MNKIKKGLYTLIVDQYQPKICELTVPFMKRYAEKIGAEFYPITERKFPKLPPVYEKFQVYELSKLHKNDWNIFFDADVLIHPDFWDVTALLDKGTTCSGYISDFTPQRFKPDEYFLRDSRLIGKGNWFAVFSDWCRDYYHPLDDITFEQAVANITPIVEEEGTLVKADHLIDDYLVSRNIARYGLKHTLISELKTKFNTPDPVKYLWHNYTVSNDQKIMQMHQAIINWAQDVYTYPLPTGGRGFKPIIKGKTVEEMQDNLVDLAQKTVDTWLGKKIPTMQLRMTDPQRTQVQPLTQPETVQIVDGKVVVPGVKE